MTDATSRQGSTSQDPPTPTDIDFVALQPGQAIGRYQIVSILGQGGFGITYRARDSQLGRDVAIKEYLPTALAVRHEGITVLPRSTKVAEDFSWGRERFVAEGRTLATLQRAPAIVRVFDFLEVNGTAYIVMELVPGHTLEGRLHHGRLGPDEVARILSPLLDGLEQVHATGFLHRDIKPANILLDDEGNPTLIDFGASRAAMAGRSTAMTAIFTPGYAAAEQFTSAKQGPWTDIYGISATLYQAITGNPPPSAFDRMLDDACRPLAELKPEGFSAGLLVGLDAGLAVRAADRPQSIASWRPLLALTQMPADGATVALSRTRSPDVTQVMRGAPPPTPAAPLAAGGRRPLWLALVAIALLLAASGGYWFAARPMPADPAVVEAARQKQVAAEVEAAKQEARDGELARLKAEAAAREQVEREAAQRRQIEEETWRKIEAELAAKHKAEDEELQRQAAEAAAKQKAEEEARRAAETAETALRLSTTDRQRIQVALTALGFASGATDGTFGTRTREVIAGWQKARHEPATGFVTGPQNQALLRDAAPAMAKFDEEQRKADEARKKAEEDKRKADDEKARPIAAAAPAAAHPAAPGLPPAAGPDGTWQGTYHCTPSKGGGDFTMMITIDIVNGAGTYNRPGAGPQTIGNQSVSFKFNGNRVQVNRVYTPMREFGVYSTASFIAQTDGRTITGLGAERNSGGRNCDINMTKVR